MSIILDPSHGGDSICGKSTPYGSRGPAGSLEKDLTLALAMKVADRLGGRARLTRTDDHNLSLADRIAFARRHGARQFVSLHLASQPYERRGPTVWVHRDASGDSLMLAHRLANALARGGDAAPCVKTAELAVLSPSRFGGRTAACMVEIDNLSNPEVERWLTYGGGLDDIAHRLSRALEPNVVETKCWMKALPDDTKLEKIVMPGSHDAGMHMVIPNLKCPVNWVRTQYKNIYNQLYAGVRAFDIRCFSKDNVMRLGHFLEPMGKLKGTAGFGGWGPTLTTVANDIKRFLTENPSETVILRIGHTKGVNAERVIADIWAQIPESMRYRGVGCISDKPLAELRGKAIVACEKEFGKVHDQAKGIHSLSKDPGANLTICGEFSNSKTRQKIWDGQDARMTTHHAVHRSQDAKIAGTWLNESHLAMMYWTSTGGNVLANTYRLWNDESLEKLKKMMATYRPNIVLHDFCDQWTCAKILAAAYPGWALENVERPLWKTNTPGTDWSEVGVVFDGLEPVGKGVVSDGLEPVDKGVVFDDLEPVDEDQPLIRKSRS